MPLCVLILNGSRNVSSGKTAETSRSPEVMKSERVPLGCIDGLTSPRTAELPSATPLLFADHLGAAFPIDEHGSSLMRGTVIA